MEAIYSFSYSMFKDHQLLAGCMYVPNRESLQNLKSPKRVSLAACALFQIMVACIYSHTVLNP